MGDKTKLERSFEGGGSGNFSSQDAKGNVNATVNPEVKTDTSSCIALTSLPAQLRGTKIKESVLNEAIQRCGGGQAGLQAVGKAIMFWMGERSRYLSHCIEPSTPAQSELATPSHSELDLLPLLPLLERQPSSDTTSSERVIDDQFSSFFHDYPALAEDVSCVTSSMPNSDDCWNDRWNRWDLGMGAIDGGQMQREGCREVRSSIAMDIPSGTPIFQGSEDVDLIFEERVCDPGISPQSPDSWAASVLSSENLPPPKLRKYSRASSTMSLIPGREVVEGKTDRNFSPSENNCPVSVYINDPSLPKLELSNKWSVFLPSNKDAPVSQLLRAPSYISGSSGMDSLVLDRTSFTCIMKEELEPLQSLNPVTRDLPVDKRFSVKMEIDQGVRSPNSPYRENSEVRQRDPAPSAESTRVARKSRLINWNRRAHPKKPDGRSGVSSKTCPEVVLPGPLGRSKRSSEYPGQGRHECVTPKREIEISSRTYPIDSSSSVGKSAGSSELPSREVQALSYNNRGDDLHVLIDKVLQRSDVGSLGRIILPKREAERQLPPLAGRAGIPLVCEDYHTGENRTLRYRYWPNNKSRMYVLEKTWDFVRRHELQELDKIVIYRRNQEGTYVIRALKAGDPDWVPSITCRRHRKDEDIVMVSSSGENNFESDKHSSPGSSASTGLSSESLFTNVEYPELPAHYDRMGTKRAPQLGEEARMLVVRESNEEMVQCLSTEMALQLVDEASVVIVEDSNKETVQSVSEEIAPQFGENASVAT